MNSVINSVMPSPQVSILLVDDEPRFREGLRTLLTFYAAPHDLNLHIIGEAATVDQTLAIASQRQPQLVLLDLELPTDSGIETLLQLRQQQYTGKVLVLSAHEEEEWIFAAMQAGAQGYVFKEKATRELPPAIQTVMAGQIYLSPDVATCFFRRFQSLSEGTLQSVRALALTEREQEVLHWLVQGESNAAIARRLYVTVATVKAHLTSIFEKLAVRNRSQAIVKAMRLGLVQT
ncbi:MAG: response regulator transcription factor [Cyanobacteria bacterium P01_G01_bin.54]